MVSFECLVWVVGLRLIVGLGDIGSFVVCGCLVDACVGVVCVVGLLGFGWWGFLIVVVLLCCGRFCWWLVAFITRLYVCVLLLCLFWIRGIDSGGTARVSWVCCLGVFSFERCWVVCCCYGVGFMTSSWCLWGVRFTCFGLCVGVLCASGDYWFGFVCFAGLVWMCVFVALIADCCLRSGCGGLVCCLVDCCNFGYLCCLLWWVLALLVWCNSACCLVRLDCLLIVGISGCL